jgi:hypothetical protein
MENSPEPSRRGGPGRRGGTGTAVTIAHCALGGVATLYVATRSVVVTLIGAAAAVLLTWITSRR